jgi:hypothetical protein
MKVKTNNLVKLTPLNPNVSLANEDFIQRALFPKDDTLTSIVNSTKFKKLLVTDAISIEGRDYIAQYYGIDDWAQIKEKGKNNGLNQDLASSYFYLLKVVKTKSRNDTVWISFNEGLHRHAALLISLLSAVFNPAINIFKNKSLTASYFKQQLLLHFKDVTEHHTNA